MSNTPRTDAAEELLYSLIWDTDEDGYDREQLAPVSAVRSEKVRELERENAALRAVAMKLIVNNGGPLQLEEQMERDSVDDYIMIKLQDFEALCAAIDAARKEAQP